MEKLYPMKYELRGQTLYKIKEEKVTDLDTDREIAVLESEIAERQERLNVLRSYKIKKDGQVQLDGGTTK